MKIYRSKKLLLSIIIILAFSFNLFAQKEYKSFCSFDNIEIERLLSSKSDCDGVIEIQNSYRVRVYIHVVRSSIGHGGQSTTAVNEAINILSNDFNPHGISFEIVGNIDYIDDDFYYNAPNLSVFNINPHNDGVDIYLFDDDSSVNDGGTNSDSTAFFLSGIISNQSLTRSSAISHEMAHVFNLSHTYANHCTLDRFEWIDGTDCDSRGDWVCDTPADPYHFSFPDNYTNPYPNVNEDCNWVATLENIDCTPQEPISNYNPDITNIMAYAPPNCMDHFTLGQGLRMKKYLECLPRLIATWEPDFYCPENVTITERVDGFEVLYVASSNTIISSSNIYPNAVVEYNAGLSITLIPGFHAQSDSNFRAHIHGCQTNAKNDVSNLNTNKQQTISVYPNPSNINITIQASEDFYKYIIYDSLTQNIILSNNHQGKSSSLNISKLKKGIYIIKVFTENGLLYSKFVKD
ncbi:MAG: zinc-dependent metalloprotease [Flavobacteriaceae bacterium]